MNAGFAYVATGKGYVAEAVQSAESLHTHHPNVPICLITDNEPRAPHPFQTVLVRADVVHKPIDKLLAVHAPYDRVVFLDSDTQVFGDMSPLFEVLDQFDLAALQDVNRGWNYELPGVPSCFTEFNTGVIAFRRSPEVIEFFRRWRENHGTLKQRPDFDHSDQPAFRQTLYFSPLRIAPLPAEFHFLGSFPNSLLWKVRLLHTRGDMEAIRLRIDEQLGGRAYIPAVGVVPSFAGRLHWLRVTLRTTWRMLRLVIRPPADPARANPGQWWVRDNVGTADKPGT